MKQAARDARERTDGLTTPERDELRQLRRELRQVKLEREILSKATAWFARETGTIPSGSTGSLGITRPRLPGRDHVSRPPGLL